jgi:hypothetical protein
MVVLMKEKVCMTGCGEDVSFIDPLLDENDLSDFCLNESVLDAMYDFVARLQENVEILAGFEKPHIAGACMRVVEKAINFALLEQVAKSY